jgi:hypothetical protein
MRKEEAAERGGEDDSLGDIENMEERLVEDVEERVVKPHHKRPAFSSHLNWYAQRRRRSSILGDN